MTQTLALSTLNYAIECVLNGEKALACDVIEASDFLPDQKTYIQKAIKESGEKIAPGRELSRFENRLIGAVQPATYSFLENADLVARVLSFLQYQHLISPLMRSPDFFHSALSLSVQRGATEVHQSLLRLELKAACYIAVENIPKYLNLLRHPESKEPLQLHEFFALAPNFTHLSIGFREINFEALAEALKKCPQTKFRSVIDYTCSDQRLAGILTLPFFTEFELASNFYKYSSFHLLEGSKLKSLRIAFTNLKPKRRYFENFSRMPFLEKLDLSGSQELKNRHILKLAQISTLRRINLGRITLEGIRALLNAAPHLKVVQLPFIPEEKREGIEKLVKDFPLVEFRDFENIPYRRS